VIEQRGWIIFGGLGGLVTIGQAYLLLQDLINSKPYKIVDPSDVFYYTAYVGVPASLILCAFLIYFIRHRIVRYLLPLVPVIAFPIFVWSCYQILFVLFGIDFFSGSGDFTVRQSELEFANDIMHVLYLGCLGGLIAVGISVVVAKTFDRAVDRIESSTDG